MIRLVGQWLKRECGMIFGVLIMAGLLLICTFLYGESIRATLLTLWMCGFFFLFWCVGSLYFFWRRNVALQKTQKELQHSLDSLPQAADNIEVQYQEMLMELYGKCGRLEQVLSERESDEKDYYTLWVHQIKTPIAAMRLMLQNMGEQNTDQDTDQNTRELQPKELQKKIVLLSNELFRIEQYAKMALQYVRLQETGVDLSIRPCDVYEVMKQVLKQYKSIFIEKKLTISFEPFVCEVVTDEKWLAFILEQVLSNAMKYTEKGGITIQCLVNQEANEDERTYTLIVQDTGIGIRKEDLPRIYEKGFTGYNGHMDKRSTGIGLYLCKKTADMLGMQIRVESILHEGTTVKLVM